VAALTVTLYRSDPPYHYLVIRNAVRGLRSYSTPDDGRKVRPKHVDF